MPRMPIFCQNCDVIFEPVCNENAAESSKQRGTGLPCRGPQKRRLEHIEQQSVGPLEFYTERV